MQRKSDHSQNNHGKQSRTIAQARLCDLSLEDLLVDGAGGDQTVDEDRPLLAITA